MSDLLTAWLQGLVRDVSVIARQPCPDSRIGDTGCDTCGDAHWLYPDPPDWAQGIIIVGVAEQPIYKPNWHWLCDRLWEDFGMYEGGG